MLEGVTEERKEGTGERDKAKSGDERGADLSRGSG